MRSVNWRVDESVAELHQLVRDFGEKEIRPRFRELEARPFPRQLYRQMGELGFFGCCFPEEYGGTGAGAGPRRGGGGSRLGPTRH